MARTTSSMVLKVWNLVADKFNHTELAANWDAIDIHNHTTGKGIQIPTAGIQDLNVTTAKLADLAVITAKLADNSVTAAKVAAGVLTAAKMSIEAWTDVGTTPPFLNSWTNNGGGYNTTSFFKDLSGNVTMKGTALRTGTPANNESIFTLPVGYRPVADAIFINPSNYGPQRIIITSAGAVTVNSISGYAALGASNTASFDGVHFRGV